VRLKKSKLENLYRHANSLHYARVRVNGKAKERSLELKDYNTAADLLPEILTKMSGAPDEHKGDTLLQFIQHHYQHIGKRMTATMSRGTLDQVRPPPVTEGGESPSQPPRSRLAGKVS
jgi:hypothetical protein